MKDEPEIKPLPCPWCGEEPIVTDDPTTVNRHGWPWAVKCIDGGCPVNPQTFGHSRSEVVRSWNRRAASSPQEPTREPEYPKTRECPECGDGCGYTVHDDGHGNAEQAQCQTCNLFAQGWRAALDAVAKCHPAPISPRVPEDNR